MKNDTYTYVCLPSFVVFIITYNYIRIYKFLAVFKNAAIFHIKYYVTCHNFYCCHCYLLIPMYLIPLDTSWSYWNLIVCKLGILNWYCCLFNTKYLPHCYLFHSTYYQRRSLFGAWSSLGPSFQQRASSKCIFIFILQKLQNPICCLIITMWLWKLLFFLHVHLPLSLYWFFHCDFAEM